MKENYRFRSMSRHVENVLAVIGLLALIGGCAVILLSLDRVAPSPCDATVQQCGYGMYCDKKKCYVRRKQ